MAGRHGRALGGNGYSNDDGFGNEEDFDDAFHCGFGGRGVGGRGYGSSSNSYGGGQSYQDGRYDGNNAYHDAQYGGSGAAPRRGVPQGMYASPALAGYDTGPGSNITPKYPNRQGGRPGTTRFPNPTTAYAMHPYPPQAAPAPPPPTPPPLPAPPPPQTASSAVDSRHSQSFGGVAGQLLSAAGQLSSPAKVVAGGKSPHSTVSDVQASASHALYAPSAGGAGDIPFVAPSSGGGGGGGGDDYSLENNDDREPHHEIGRGEDGNRGDIMRDSRQQQQQQQQQRQKKKLEMAQAAAAAAGGGAGGRTSAHSSRSSGSGNLGNGRPSSANGDSSREGVRSFGGNRRSRSSSPRAARHVAPPTNEPPASGQEPPPVAKTDRSIAAPKPTPSPPGPWAIIERAAKRQLGCPAEERRSKPKPEIEKYSPFRGCPIPDCTTVSSDGPGVSWMTRHLESHTKVAADKSQEDVYIRSSVAEALHEMCLDVEVPPRQRKFERKKMARALLKNPQPAMGQHFGMVETMVTGDNPDPSVRRCALDLSAGGCEGVTRKETIVRCDKCRAWYHVSCGQMALGDGITGPSTWDETLCRNCARTSVGALQRKEPTATLQKQLRQVRVKRRKMMEGVEEDVKRPRPQGVFGTAFYMEDKVKEGAVRGAGENGGSADASANGENALVVVRGGASGGAGRDGGLTGEVGGPVCKAQWCNKHCRTDSNFCSSVCGVLHAEDLLIKSVQHTLEPRLGLERGRGLRETRELKVRRQQIGIAMRKIEHPKVPGFQTERETALQAMVVRRCRLWQRLIEIGAYWEKVSGSRILSTSTRGVAQTSRRQAPVAALGASAAGGALVVASASASASASRDNTAPGGSPSKNAQERGGSGGSSRAAAAPKTAQVVVESTSSGTAGDQPVTAAREDGGGGGSVTPRATTNPAPADQPTVRELDRAGGEPELEVDVGLDGAHLHPKTAGEVWTYASVGNLNVVWYCPPKGETSDRLSSRVQLEAYWRKKYGNTQIPSWFTFRVKDAPRHWKGMDIGLVWENARPAKKMKVGAGSTAVAAAAAATTEAAGAAAARATAATPLAAAGTRTTVPTATATATRTTAPTPGVAAALVETTGEGAGPAAAVAAAEAEDEAELEMGGVHDFVCVYCGEETGPRVNEHLERCYRMVSARRNHRLKCAKLLPLPARHYLDGGSRSGMTAVTGLDSVPPTAALNSSAAIGRQLLSRQVSFADLASLPDPTRFQLHQDLQGWVNSSSRLDYLYKELVRQRNAAIYELQALDREEAELEVRLRRDWIKDDLRSVPRLRSHY